MISDTLKSSGECRSTAGISIWNWASKRHKTQSWSSAAPSTNCWTGIKEFDWCSCGTEQQSPVSASPAAVWSPQGWEWLDTNSPLNVIDVTMSSFVMLAANETTANLSIVKIVRTIPPNSTHCPLPSSRQRTQILQNRRRSPQITPIVPPLRLK